MTPTRMRRRFATGLAAATLGAGALLVTAGPASAGNGDDGVNMACTKVTDAGADAGAAGALAMTGLKLEGVDKPVGFACQPVKDPSKANFCATATMYNGAIALGSPDPC